MSQLTIHDLDESTLRRLQRRAEVHNHSAEAEARAILAQTLAAEEEVVWSKVDAIHARLAASGRTFSDSAELQREGRER
jgi:plasmid stability protein